MCPMKRVEAIAGANVKLAATRLSGQGACLDPNSVATLPCMEVNVAYFPRMQDRRAQN